MEHFLSSLYLTFGAQSILLIAAGTFVGIVVGALPGLSATMGVAILLPVTYYLSASHGMLLLLGIYTGGIYGGSIAAVLLNIPGCPASVMTTLDGYPMAQRGEGGRGIGIATVCSFIGGTLGVCALIFTAPVLAGFALSFGPAEYALLALLGLSAIVVVVTKSVIKGFISAVIGLFLGTVGMDPVVSVPRFTYGQMELLGGINYIPVVIGLFGLAEVFTQAMDSRHRETVKQVVRRVIPTSEDFRIIFRNCWHPSWIGTLIGALPGAGAAIAAIISYNRAVATSRHPERFGTGITEGLVACETANNASIGGAMVPLMTLGIPGSSVTAVLLGAMLMHNITPGPMLFVNNIEMVYTIFIGMILANFFMLVFGLMCAKTFPHLINLPKTALLPTITLLCIIGAFALSNSLFDVGIMLASGILGFFLREMGVSSGPLILGLILGPIAEANFRGAMELSGGSLAIFAASPISLILLCLVLAMLALPFIRNHLARRKTAPGP